jgi:hypothetical protein
VEGFLYLLDVVFVIWILILVHRNDSDPEAMNKGLLGVFSMAQRAEKQKDALNRQGKS